MEIESLDTLNDIANATAAVITTEMGFKIQQRRKEEPAWKRRVETKISKLRRDLSQIESWRSGKLQNECVQRNKLLDERQRLSSCRRRVEAEDHGTIRGIEEIPKQDRPIQADPRVSNQSEAAVLQVARRNTE